MLRSIPGRVLTALALSVGLAGAASAAELRPDRAHVVPLGSASAVAYYTVEPDGSFRVVATLQEEGATPVRAIASLRSGQVAVVSVPGAEGRAPAELVLERQGDRLTAVAPHTQAATTER